MQCRSRASAYSVSEHACLTASLPGEADQCQHFLHTTKNDCSSRM